MDTDTLQQLPVIRGHDDLEAATDALASARERLRDLEERKAELEAQIPELKSDVDDLRVEVAQGEAQEEDLEEALESVRSTENELEELESERIPSQELAVERLDQNVEDTKDELGNRFAGPYHEAAIELLRSKAEACRELADVLDLVETFDGKRGRNRVQNAYGPEVPTVPTLSEEVSDRRDTLGAEELRNVADDLEARAARLEEEG
jgi:DNA repair exonuclease SbcCD ATPase subunit